MTIALARAVNLLLSLAGFATFAGLFLYVTLAPQDFDRQVRDFAISRIQESTGLGTGVEQLIARATADDHTGSMVRDAMARLVPERMRLTIMGQYQAVMAELRRDVTIFSGSSFLAFALAFALSLLRGQAARHQLPISLALSLATFLAASWYVFGQNWIMTILFNDYYGWAYAIILAGLMLLMADIAINRARITTYILNGIGDAIGQSFALTPC